ncbi:zinc ribbon domain-containing protein [Halorubrum vacuolatum]|uniref:DUF7575 domain-containing protein n=1 Tax=Halorubrum vacuolatum TaxID=63740 RepID=A0A238VRR4_HALVU|nr:zinc ribbon domain-containing protein [Halorubrum vacuolatum]SNR36189.1 hypothetical protein SAMN06264855_103234 [Halorubrum vacuolatum]
MRDRLRPLLAAFLAIVLPGLGHLVLRQWGRALVWHVTIVGGTVALFVLYDVEPGDPLADPSAFTAAVPVEVSVPVTFLVGLSALDAYLVGRADATEATTNSRTRRGGQTVGAGNDTSGEPTDDGMTADDEGVPTVKCPSCGRETDAEIDFCHWCTEPLPGPNSAD